MKLEPKTRIILILGFTALMALLTILAVVIQGQNKAKTTKLQIAEGALSNSLTTSTGGIILGDGYEINYLTETKEIMIKITAEPFADSKRKAIEYLKSIGIDLCQANYTFQAAQGITNPEINNPNGATCTP